MRRKKVREVATNAKLLGVVIKNLYETRGKRGSF